ncbi:MAG: MFS transporter [Steroidobacteraceae bacterium]
MNANSDGGSFGSPAYRWYVLIILTTAYTVSFIDRQVLALLIAPIRRDFHISDTQVSLLIGLAFAIFYILLGIPIGWIADRRSRRGTIAAGISIWCFMAAACGITRSYMQLFYARVGVGVGEAALSPSALSLISDYFSKETRGRAISVYTMGIALGSGLAMIIGGQLVTVAEAVRLVHLPVIGEIFGWQRVFLVIGLPGLLLAALMGTVREPPRKEALPGTSAGTAARLPLRQVVVFFGSNWRLYGSHFLGLSVAATLTYGFLAWIPTMFVRTWGWSIARVGVAYGVVMILSGVLTVFVVSWLARRLHARGRSDAYMRSALYCTLFGVVGAVLTPIAPIPLVALLMLVPMTVGMLAATSAGLAGLMVVTPNQMRAQASALYYLVVNLIGLTAGPTGIALFTDHVFHNDALLRYSILSVSIIVGVLALLVLTYNLGQYRKAVAASEAWSTQGASSLESSTEGAGSQTAAVDSLSETSHL